MSNAASATTATASSLEGGGSPVIVNMFKHWAEDGTRLTQEWTVLELLALNVNLLCSAVTSTVVLNSFATKIYAKYPQTAHTVTLNHHLQGGGPRSPICKCGEDAEPEPAIHQLSAWPTDTPMADPPIANVAPGSVGEG